MARTEQTIIVTPEGQAYGPFGPKALERAIELEAERRYGSKTEWAATNLIGDEYLIIPLNPAATLIREARQEIDSREAAAR